MTHYTQRQLTSHVGQGLATLTPRPRLTKQTLAELQRRLTARDLWLLGMLAEHRVLTTIQITDLVFDTGTAARHRLHTLHELRAVDRFRPLTLVGSAPWHYVLGEAGARVLAAHRGTEPADLPYRPDQTPRLARSQQLAHTIAVNDFFTALAAAARGDPDTELATWWPERRCGAAWGHIIRPDGYGVWHHHGTRIDFFAEIDLGTEPLDRLIRKVDAYTRLNHTTGIHTPVLFALTSTRREYGLHTALGTPPIPVATTTGNPADPSWLPVTGNGTRTSLAQLAPDTPARKAG